MPMSPRLLRPRASSALVATDADAKTYINAVRTADGGQYMEAGVQLAIDAFITGCKADGIWSAIKASCLLIGARTLSGALTPLVGTAPTNNNFVSGDYNRKTGLVGNASTKYLNANRANNADGQNDQHLSVYMTVAPGDATVLMSAGGTGTGASGLIKTSTFSYYGVRSRNGTLATGASIAGTGFFGKSRSESSLFVARNAGADATINSTSQTPSTDNMFVFARNSGTGTANTHTAARLAFYSIGSNLTLSLLDTRVSNLYTAIGNAIA